MPGRHRHRHHALHAARARRGQRHPRGLALRQLRRPARARDRTCPDFDAFYERLRTADAAADHLAAVDRRLPRGLRAAASRRAATSSRSTSRGGISGTVESARQAAAELGARRPQRRIEVVDSRERLRRSWPRRARRRSGGARAGGDVDAVAARVRRRVDALKIWFAVDTLEFLRRGGRIGAAQAWLGGALKIKPILTVEGEITPIERVRTAGRAFERMVDYLRARHDDGCDALGRPAHPGARAGARARRARPRDLRHRARSSSPRSAR